MESINMYCIYLHTNRLTQDKYVGQTSMKPEDRWGANGNGYKKSPKFYAAIQKYGWDNFEHTILETGLSAHEANLREVYWIAFYDTYGDQSHGYNLTPGGNNYMELLWQDPEYRQKMCARFSEIRKQSWSNVEFAQKSLTILLEGLHKAWQDPEWRKRRIENLLGDKNPNAKAVINIETGLVFSTIKNAAEWAGLKTQGTIGECCKGKRNTSGIHPETGEKLHWKFITDLRTNEEILMTTKNKSKIAVQCLNTSKIFESMSAAAKWCGLKDYGKSIKACCNGQQKTAGNHPETKERLTWSFIVEGGDVE